jgi:hypothetical protein
MEGWRVNVSLRAEFSEGMHTRSTGGEGGGLGHDLTLERHEGRRVVRSVSDQVNKLKMPHICTCTVHVGIALICSIGSHVRIAIARILIGYSSNQSSLSSYLCYPMALGWKKAISNPPSHLFRGRAHIHRPLSD